MNAITRADLTRIRGGYDASPARSLSLQAEA